MTYNPVIFETSRHGVRTYDVWSRLLKDRIVFLGADVNNYSANTIVAQLLLLEAEDPTKEIKFYINSPGGVITAGMAIYDTMQLIKAPVSTICVGLAASMGAFLLSGGESGRRFALPNAEIMIHQPSGGARGQASDIEITARSILRTKEKLNKLLAKNTGQPLDKVIADTERDTWLMADEAVEYGLIDKVITKKV